MRPQKEPMLGMSDLYLRILLPRPTCMTFSPVMNCGYVSRPSSSRISIISGWLLATHWPPRSNFSFLPSPNSTSDVSVLPPTLSVNQINSKTYKYMKPKSCKMNYLSPPTSIFEWMDRFSMLHKQQSIPIAHSRQQLRQNSSSDCPLFECANFETSKAYGRTCISGFISLKNKQTLRSS